MGETYLGKLDYADPLYEILTSQVITDTKYPQFHVNRMSSGMVYKYTEENTRVAIIGKFYRLHDTKQERLLRKKGEFDNLTRLRNYGFDTYPNYVVRPISREERIGLALTEEFIHGKDLDYYLKQAMFRFRVVPLIDNLSRLSSFLFALHSRTEDGNDVNLNALGSYFRKILQRLISQRVLSDDQGKSFLKMMDKWMKRILYYGARNVIVHGDATPTNFIFTEKGDVVAIDLERMKNCDLAYDIGMICGELKHAFMWRTGNAFAAEPYIRHFLKSYTGHDAANRKAFKDITMRMPFYMSLTELRIARNNYLSWDYRKRLAHEAMECMKWGLKLA